MAGGILAEYFARSQFHGLRFVADSRRRRSERCFWLLCVCASWYGCYLLIASSWESFVINPLSFGTETTYLSWNTTLFSVTVCESENMDDIARKAQGLYGDHDWNLIDIIKEIAFFKGNAYTASVYCSSGEVQCPGTGLREFAIKFRSECEEIFKSCVWMNEEFDCCRYFQILETELGPCFALNSIQTRHPRPISLTSSTTSGPGALRLELHVSANVYVHSPADVPFLNSISAEVVEARSGTHSVIEYGITEIINEAEVRRVDIARRRCRFPEENYLALYARYSYTACVTECRADRQRKLCNCSSHFAPGSGTHGNSSVCDMDGLLCLDRNSRLLTFMVNPWSAKPGLICSCLPGCSEAEYDVVKMTTSEINGSGSVVELAMNRLPSVRLKRSVVRSVLDLVVSMGGTVALFVGASLLSFVEIAYFFTLRLVVTRRMQRRRRRGRTAQRT